MSEERWSIQARRLAAEGSCAAPLDEEADVCTDPCRCCAGKYGTATGQTNEVSCKACPTNSTSPPGSAALTNCSSLQVAFACLSVSTPTPSTTVTPLVICVSLCIYEREREREREREKYHDPYSSTGCVCISYMCLHSRIELTVTQTTLSPYLSTCVCLCF